AEDGIRDRNVTGVQTCALRSFEDCPPSRISIAFTNPMPSSPKRFSSGTRQSSKTTLAVSDARRPSLFSFFDGANPFMPFSKMKEIGRASCRERVKMEVVDEAC